eukprot:1130228-Pleurochrysis_carterae.AAC.1
MEVESGSLRCRTAAGEMRQRGQTAKVLRPELALRRLVTKFVLSAFATVCISSTEADEWQVFIFRPKRESIDVAKRQHRTTAFYEDFENYRSMLLMHDSSHI